MGRNPLRNISREVLEEINQPHEIIPENWYEEETLKLDRFVNYHLGRFTGRETFLKENEDFLQNKTEAKILTSFSGAGKSAFMCKLFTNLNTHTNPRQIVLFHSAGISLLSSKIEKMLQRWSLQLCNAFNLNYVEINNEDPDIQEKAKEQFLQLTKTAKESRYKIILLVDALDRFSANNLSRYMLWLPEEVSLLCTSIPGFEIAPLKHHPQLIIKQLPLFTTQEAHYMLNKTCSDSNKELYSQVLSAILEKQYTDGTHACSSPLWLSLISNILFGLDGDDFKEMRERNEESNEQKMIAFFVEFVKELSPDPGELFINLLGKAQKEFGTELTLQSMRYLSVSLNGLREKDLATLLSDNWDELNFLSLRRWFKFLITETENKQWYFAHNKLTETLLAVNADENEKNHSQIANYLLTLPPTDIVRLRSAMHHLIKSNEKKPLLHYYITINEEEETFATNTIVNHYQEDNTILTRLSKYIECTDNNHQKIFFAGKFILNLEKRIRYNDREQLREIGKYFLSHIDYENCTITETKWVAEMCFRLANICEDTDERIFLFATVQTYGHQKCLEYHKDDSQGETYRNSLSMGYNKLACYYAERGEKEKSQEYIDKISLLDSSSTETIIRQALLYFAQAEEELKNGDTEAAEGNLVKYLHLINDAYLSDPTNERYTHTLIISLAKTVFFCEENQLDSYDYTIRLYELTQKLKNESRDDFNTSLANVIATQTLAKIYSRQNDFDEAFRFLDDTDEFLEILYRKYPDNETIEKNIQNQEYLREQIENMNNEEKGLNSNAMGIPEGLEPNEYLNGFQQWVKTAHMPDDGKADFNYIISILRNPDKFKRYIKREEDGSYTLYGSAITSILEEAQNEKVQNRRMMTPDEYLDALLAVTKKGDGENKEFREMMLDFISILRDPVMFDKYIKGRDETGAFVPDFGKFRADYMAGKVITKEQFLDRMHLIIMNNKEMSASEREEQLRIHEMMKDDEKFNRYIKRDTEGTFQFDFESYSKDMERQVLEDLIYKPKKAPDSKEPPKKKKFPIWLLICILIILGLSAYIIYLQFYKKEASNILNNKQVETVVVTPANSEVSPPVKPIVEDKQSEPKKELPPVKVAETKTPAKPIAAITDNESNKEETVEQQPLKTKITFERVPSQSNESGIISKTYTNGNHYEGYVNGKGERHGQGTYTWESGNKYVGEWINDQGTGKGTYYSIEGWRYEGEFKDLQFHGKGTYVFADGKRRNGTWENGKLLKLKK